MLSYPYPRIRDLPENEREEFEQALVGQTRPLVFGIAMENQDFFYYGDYLNWKEYRNKLPVFLWD